MRITRRLVSRGRCVTMLVYVLLLALVVSVACPPAAFATPETLAPGTKGSILIRYSKDYATYDVYRLFDLAGPSDANAPAQDADAYAYVIKETVETDAGADGTKKPNPWWTFLTTYGPDGKNSSNPYAVSSVETNASRAASALFVFDAERIALDGQDDYHVVRVSDRYSGFSDIMRGTASTREASDTDPYAPVQGFAKAALSFAKGQDLGWQQGHFLAAGRETYGSAVGQTDVDSVYQYSGDTAYVANIPLGVYLLDVEEGKLCSIDMTHSSTLVYDRNENPELFVQVRAKDVPAMTLRFDQWDGEEQHDVAWSEDSLVRWGYRTDVNLGEAVQFKTVLIAKQGVTDYRMHDVMERGLTLIDGSSVEGDAGERAGFADGYDYGPHVYLYRHATESTVEIPRALGDKTNWVLHTTGDAEGAPSDGCDFEVEFRDVAKNDAGGEEGLTFAYEEVGQDGARSTATAEVADWDRIVVTYWARVNDDAVVFGSDEPVEAVVHADDLSQVRGGAASTGEPLSVQTHTQTDGDNRNTNNAVVTYGADAHTTWARAEAASYQFDIVRGEASSDSGSTYPLLAGAKLTLYKTVDGDTAGAIAYTTEVNRTPKNYYYLPDDPVRFVPSGTTYTYVGGASEGGASASEAELGTETLVSSDTSALNVHGIEAGVYLLVENDVPEGHAKAEQPIVVTVQSRAYANSDFVEDNTPGLRHSNAEGDLTITAAGDGGNVATDVYGWRATVSGNPAVYERRTSGASDGGTTVANGGVLVVGSATVGTTGGVGAVAIAAIVVIILIVAGFIAWKLMGYTFGAQTPR